MSLSDVGRVIMKVDLEGETGAEMNALPVPVGPAYPRGAQGRFQRIADHSGTTCLRFRSWCNNAQVE